MFVTKKQLRTLLAGYWQPTTLYAVLLIAAGAMLWFRLGSLTGGYSSSELATFHAGDSFRHILDNPVNAPYLVLVRCLLFIHQHSLICLRLIATLFGLLTLTNFYWLVRHWHGERSAVFGTIIFGCSAWFLHTARLGTPDVLLFLLLALIACVTWLKRTDNRFALLLGFLLLITLAYVPGMIWFLVIGAAWQIKTIIRLYKHHLPIMLIGLGSSLALLAPLGWAVYQTPRLALTLAGLPTGHLPSVIDSLHRLADVPAQLFFHGPLDAQRWLGTIPVLDAFSIVMLTLGVYVYAKHYHLLRAKLLGAVLVISALLIALGGAVGLSILIPFVYILVAAGLGLMLDRWYRVFPRNAIAQGVGIGLIGLAVVATCWYGLRHYFVAWPHTPATQQVFTIKR